ncbi:hypothetical protein [Streptomyces sp. NEAU-S7GS2]|uniref:hypothetical protein n=1 Tax=Streptomyces sp. NEAU-S7GS2 TaxID=2202000 RepID=UPI000D6EBB94|nr:hypothetical protein [Streptomyces sp. NEAU-S7GS2]AWN24793.1 hypothetical protein DKG71_00110 [Streptomyces sp. NEAU-S7GS2]
MSPSLPPGRRSRSDRFADPVAEAPRLRSGAPAAVDRAGLSRSRVWSRGLVPVALVLLVAALVAVAWSSGARSLWWPQTGNAFTPASRQDAGHDIEATSVNGPCDLISGPARDYCARRATASPAPEPEPSRARPSAQARIATGMLGVGALAAGVGALVVLRRRP